MGNCHGNGFEEEDDAAIIAILHEQELLLCEKYISMSAEMVLMLQRMK